MIHGCTSSNNGDGGKGRGVKKLEVLVLLLFHFFPSSYFLFLFIHPLTFCFDFFNFLQDCWRLGANTDKAFSHNITFKCKIEQSASYLHFLSVLMPPSNGELCSVKGKTFVVFLTTRCPAPATYSIHRW